MFSINCFAQDAEKTVVSIDNVNKEIKNIDDVQYIRNCLDKYYKVRKSARILSFVSIASAGYAISIDDETKRNNVLYVSGASALIAIIGNISAEKWLKRASLKPADSGLGIKFEF